MFDKNFDITISMETEIGHKFKINTVDENGCYLNIFHKGENASREFYMSKEEIFLLTILLEKARESMPENERG